LEGRISGLFRVRGTILAFALKGLLWIFESKVLKKIFGPKREEETGD